MKAEYRTVTIDGQEYFLVPLRSFSLSEPEPVKKEEKSKPVILTTEDGKEITYVGDTVYMVSEEWRKDNTLVANVKHHYPGPRWKAFSTVNARNEWIAENKPLFSFNDVQGILAEYWGCLWDVKSRIEGELRKLAKERVK